MKTRMRMSKLEIKGIPHEAYASGLIKILELLKEIRFNLDEVIPDRDYADKAGIAGYYETITEADGRFSDVTSQIAEAFGALIACDTTSMVFENIKSELK